MPLTPEDVSNKRFTPVRLREGYDMGEVDQFLDEVEAELARLTRENEDLRSKLSAAQQGGGSTPADRGAGAGSGADGIAPDATKAPRRAHGPTGGSAASPGAPASKSDAPQVRAREATTEDGSGADSS